ncbi:ERF family protein [Anaerobacillus isosaccharinicus]|uniref:Single-stranded DNA-binding protein n=2 Tax=Anaerobacillus isosaccharinicus TaxID=1532552 RepID=A0A1S2L1C5_9BACI|nr:ERF family protein [Anaerobacillus isosaccharinicus]
MAATKKNIFQKLIEVRKSVPYLQKSSSGHQYAYVGSSTVLGALREKLDEVGLMLFPKVLGSKVTPTSVENTDQKGNKRISTTYFTELTLEFLWVDAETGEQIAVPFYAQGIDIGGEKGVGKALTYAEKYFLLKQFNIATDSDDPDSFQQKSDQSKPNYITTAQATELTAIADELAALRGTPADNYKSALKVKSFEKVTVNQFGEIRSALVGWLNKAKAEALPKKEEVKQVDKPKTEATAKKEEPKKETPKAEKPVETKKEEVKPVEQPKVEATKVETPAKKEEVKQEEATKVITETKNEEVKTETPSDVTVIEGELVKFDIKMRKHPKTGEETPFGQMGVKTADGKVVGVIAFGQEKINLLDEVDQSNFRMSITPMENSPYFLLEEVLLEGATA